MKKFYFMMAAVSVMMLNACTSEDDVLQATGPQTTVQKAVGFDVYVPEAVNVTRAGLEGALTTNRLQRSEYEGGGFGVYAYQVQDEIADAGDDAAEATTYVGKNLRTTPAAPNFMVNEKLLWNATNQGWYYNPLKYWPNETDNDSQTSAAEMLGDTPTHNHIDRLTFFAYAPYVSEGASGSGITHVTSNAGKLNSKIDGTGTPHAITGVVEPSIAYQASLDDPNEAVDLLWGVAPAGGLTYTAVNGKTVNVKEGEPLMDMTKPDVNTSMKFLFQHALARIGVTAVAAIDQVGPGGNLDPNTKITIQKITLTGLFGETGVLNLDNEKASVANWTTINGVNLNDHKTDTKVATLFSGVTPITLELAADNTAGEGTNHQLGTIARHLQFVGTPATNPYDVSEDPKAQTARIGVTTVRQNVIMPAKINNAAGANRNWYTYKQYAANELKYSETTPYYTDPACSTQRVATVYGLDGNATSTTNVVYQVNDKGVYTESSAAVTLTYPQVNDYYTLTFLKVVESGATGDQINESAAAGMQSYTKDDKTYTPEAVGKAPAEGKYVIKCDANGDPIINKAVAAYANAGKYYKRDANYFMVVPTNNVKNIVTGLNDEEKLRTVRVMIEYYITTKDSKLDGGLAQTKNVITKDVVFPSIANGKSYNLNLVLGLTSVKMEAEVDDWKVVNVQGDLPQNTAE